MKGFFSLIKQVQVKAMPTLFKPKMTQYCFSALAKKTQDHIVKMGFLTALDKQFVLRNLNYTSLNGLLQKGVGETEEDDELLKSKEECTRSMQIITSSSMQKAFQQTCGVKIDWRSFQEVGIIPDRHHHQFSHYRSPSPPYDLSVLTLSLPSLSLPPAPIDFLMRLQKDPKNQPYFPLFYGFLREEPFPDGFSRYKLFFEHMQGNLSDLLEKTTEKAVFHQSLLMFHSVLGALERLERPHGRLSPRNVLFSKEKEDNGRISFKITGFWGENHDFQAEFLAPELNFAALNEKKELFMDLSRNSMQCDIYSLALLFLYANFGRLPFERDLKSYNKLLLEDITDSKASSKAKISSKTSQNDSKQEKTLENPHKIGQNYEKNNRKGENILFWTDNSTRKKQNEPILIDSLSKNRENSHKNNHFSPILIDSQLKNKEKPDKNKFLNAILIDPEPKNIKSKENASKNKHFGPILIDSEPKNTENKHFGAILIDSEHRKSQNIHQNKAFETILIDSQPNILEIMENKPKKANNKPKPYFLSPFLFDSFPKQAKKRPFRLGLKDTKPKKGENSTFQPIVIDQEDVRALEKEGFRPVRWKEKSADPFYSDKGPYDKEIKGMIAEFKEKYSSKERIEELVSLLTECLQYNPRKRPSLAYLKQKFSLFYQKNKPFLLKTPEDSLYKCTKKRGYAYFRCLKSDFVSFESPEPRKINKSNENHQEKCTFVGEYKEKNSFSCKNIENKGKNNKKRDKNQSQNIRKPLENSQIIEITLKNSGISGNNNKIKEKTLKNSVIIENMNEIPNNPLRNNEFFENPREIPINLENTIEIFEDPNEILRNYERNIEFFKNPIEISRNPQNDIEIFENMNQIPEKPEETCEILEISNKILENHQENNQYPTKISENLQKNNKIIENPEEIPENPQKTIENPQKTLENHQKIHENHQKTSENLQNTFENLQNIPKKPNNTPENPQKTPENPQKTAENSQEFAYLKCFSASIALKALLTPSIVEESVPKNDPNHKNFFQIALEREQSLQKIRETSFSSELSLSLERKKGKTSRISEEIKEKGEVSKGIDEEKDQDIEFYQGKHQKDQEKMRETRQKHQKTREKHQKTSEKDQKIKEKNKKTSKKHHKTNEKQKKSVEKREQSHRIHKKKAEKHQKTNQTLKKSLEKPQNPHEIPIKPQENPIKLPKTTQNSVEILEKTNETLPNPTKTPQNPPKTLENTPKTPQNTNKTDEKGYKCLKNPSEDPSTALESESPSHFSFCVLCNGQVFADYIVVFPCRHNFCETCFSTFFEKSLKTVPNQVFLTCLKQDCRLVCPEETVLSLSGKHVRERVGRRVQGFVRMAEAERCNKKTVCPECGIKVKWERSVTKTVVYCDSQACKGKNTAYCSYCGLSIPKHEATSHFIRERCRKLLEFGKFIEKTLDFCAFCGKNPEKSHFFVIFLKKESFLVCGGEKMFCLFCGSPVISLKSLVPHLRNSHAGVFKEELDTQKTEIFIENYEKNGKLMLENAETKDFECLECREMIKNHGILKVGEERVFICRGGKVLRGARCQRCGICVEIEHMDWHEKNIHKR